MMEKVNKRERDMLFSDVNITLKRNKLERHQGHCDKIEQDEREMLVAKRRKKTEKSIVQVEPIQEKKLALEVRGESEVDSLFGSKRKRIPTLSQRAEMLKRRVKMINYSESLYVYNGKCYDVVDSKDVVKLYRAKVDNTLEGECSMNNISQLYQYLCTDADIMVKKQHGNQRIAVMRNGVYDVEREELFEHSPKILAFSYIDADYVDGEKCKNFDKFLETVTYGNPALIKRLWMFLGYVFMQTTEAKTFFVMGLKPDSGKSLLGNFIESVYPEKYVSNVALNDFNKDFSLAPIVGSAVNISLDLPSSKLNSGAVSRLKMLTGGDAVNINQKYVPQFRYENRAKFIFATNAPVSIYDDDNAFWRRLVFLPFDRTIPKDEQNTSLALIFQREKNAIVSKALRSAKELIEHGFIFPSTDGIEYTVQEWQGKRCSAIENFLEDCCGYSAEYKGELIDTLYKAYCIYCDKKGMMQENRNQFKRFLEEQVGLEHVKLRSDCPNPRSAFKGIKILWDME